MASFITSTFPFERHPARFIDFLLGFCSVWLVVLALVTPPTPGWKVFRAGIVAPLAAAGFLYAGVFPAKKDWEDQWGTNTLMAFFVLRAFELLLFFPAEDNVYRLKPKPGPKIVLPQKTQHALNGSTSVERTVPGQMVAEPIPPPWTMAKFYWASSLWWSWRGIGWNYAAPLPSSSQRQPFTLHSSRRKYIIRQLTHHIIGMIVADIARSYMNVSSASPFFSARPGSPAYADLTQWQRAIYSTALAIRIVLNMEKSYAPTGLIFVTVGGIMGWDGEMWSPWGWPPLFGGFGDIWRHPGLAHMWSRTWHQYFRRWLYVYGWIGIGENILHLPHSGAASRSPPPTRGVSSPPITPSITPSPSASGRTSPTHPLPSTPPSRTRRGIPVPVQLSNLIKSICVFALTGLIHDYACYCTIIYSHPETHQHGSRWTDAIVTTPFFILQPFALAVEAAVKKTWRGYKRDHGLGGKEPRWLVRVERVVGFIWTWTWLGWTARWFVEGLTRVGVYCRDGEGVYPSVAGGVIYGKWMH